MKKIPISNQIKEFILGMKAKGANFNKKLEKKIKKWKKHMAA